jgi:hypothetical protein
VIDLSGFVVGRSAEEEEHLLRRGKAKMMKSYLRYEPAKMFGVIASPQCNATYDWRLVEFVVLFVNNQLCSGNMAISGSLQTLSVWNMRQAHQVELY